MFAQNKIFWRKNVDLDLDSWSDNFSLQRREQHVSKTHSSSFFWDHHVVFIDLNLEL